MAKQPENHKSATLKVLNVAKQQEILDPATLEVRSVAKWAAVAPEMRVHPGHRQGKGNGTNVSRLTANIQICVNGLSGLEENGKRIRRCRRQIGAAVAVRCLTNEVRS